MSIVGRQYAILLALVVAPPVAVLGYVFWLLHTPDPELHTTIVIGRSSLLPHRYAGPCMNCHSVRKDTLVPINRQNLATMALPQRDRLLVLAGQRVDPPRPLVLTPAITRIDILPHSYVGICSNCHVELDIHPSPVYMARSLQRAHQPLLDGTLSPIEIAYAGAHIDRRRGALRNLIGYAAIVTLLLLCGFIGARWIRRGLGIPVGPLKRWLALHEWCGILFALLTTLHWILSDRGNNPLHLALLVVVWLALEGALLRFLMVKGPTHRSPGLVHTQRVVFASLLALLLVGHLLSNLA